MAGRRTGKRTGGVLSVLLKTLLVLVILLAIGGFFIWKESQGGPDWYQPPDPAAPEVDQLAQDVQYNTLAEMQRIRPAEAETWELALSEDEVNAWLAAGLPGWIEHDASVDWPSELGAPQVRFSDGRASIAISVGSGMFQRVVTTHYTPVLTDEGLRLDPAGVTVGNIDMPGGAASGSAGLAGEIAGALDQQGSQELQKWLSFLRGSQTIPARFELSDGRIVELRGLTISQGSVVLENRTRSGRAGEAVPDGAASATGE